MGRRVSRKTKEEMTTVEVEVGGKKITLETGRLAKQANGAVLVRCGDTMVLVSATGRTTGREGQDFFPLTVDVEERHYAAGKIPGGFIKRESRPSEKAVLAAGYVGFGALSAGHGLSLAGTLLSTLLIWALPSTHYEPLGLPPSTIPFRHRLIGTAFARRGPPGRVSPVPYQAVVHVPSSIPRGRPASLRSSRMQSIAFAVQ